MNNGILLISFINRLRQQGVSKDQAKAGTTWLRAILITSLTTIFGVLSIAPGKGGEVLQPLGAVVVAAWPHQRS